MVDVLVPLTRARIPDSRVRTSLVVSSEEWGGAAELAAWIQGSGGVALAAHHVGLEIDTGSPTTILDTSLTSASYGWWRGSTVALEILVGCHREGTDGGFDGKIAVTLGDGTSTLGSWDIPLTNELPMFVFRSKLMPFALAERAGEIRLVATAIATTTGLYVDVVQVLEQARSKLELDEADCAALSSSCGPNSPINDVPHLSVRGAADAVLCADWRRLGYFHHGTRNNPIVIGDTGGDYLELFPFGIPMQAQVRAPGDTSSTEVVVVIEAKFDPDAGGTAALVVATDVGLGEDEQPIEDDGWSTFVFSTSIKTEDLDSDDGRRGAEWELLRISALVEADVGSSPTLRVGTIGVFAANAAGERGWTTSSYLVQPSAAPMAGSGAMTRAALVYVRNIVGTQTILSTLSSNTGWQLNVTGAGRFAFTYGDGATLHSITSAPITAGRVYAVAASWDGAKLHLVVGQTVVTAVAGGGALVAGTACSLGALPGSSPAAGLTIVGVAASDAVALSEAQMQELNALHSAVADARSFAGCEHLYSARDGLHVDLVGEDHFTINGATTLERFVPRLG